MQRLVQIRAHQNDCTVQSLSIIPTSSARNVLIGKCDTYSMEWLVQNIFDVSFLISPVIADMFVAKPGNTAITPRFVGHSLEI